MEAREVTAPTPPQAPSSQLEASAGPLPEVPHGSDLHSLHRRVPAKPPSALPPPQTLVACGLLASTFLEPRAQPATEEAST